MLSMASRLVRSETDFEHTAANRNELGGILAGFFLGEAISCRIVSASAMSLLGVLLGARPSILFGESEASLEPLWVGVALVGAFVIARSIWVARGRMN